MASLVINVPGEYVSLGLVMQSALEQASNGKGKMRHANEGEAYEKQIICEVARRVGLGYPLGQAVKKIYESQRLISQLGVQELLGAINYLAAAVIVMQERMEEEGRRFREGFAHAEGGRCQNGKDHANPLSFEEQAKTFAKHNPPEEPEGNHPENPDSSPEFRSGDRVQFRDEIPSTSEPHWFEGVYVERLSDGGHAVKFGPHGHVIHCSDKEIRLAPKAEGCEELEDEDEEERRDHEFLEGVFAPYAEKKPEFKPGDKVQVYFPSIAEWRDATYVSFCQMARNVWRHEVEFSDGGRRYPLREHIRIAPKAEGCEELVQKDLADECGGCLYRLAADAPQTPEETCQRIVDSNPATFHTPSYAEEQLEHHSRLQARTPTGEELAEMAEEVPDGH